MEVSDQLHAPAALPRRERAPSTHWIGGWVGPRAVLDAVVKRKIPSSRRESNSRTPSIQPVAQTELSWRFRKVLSLFVDKCFPWFTSPRQKGFGLA
jgi:hypothetical protein